jgi:hypothetical protein
MATQEKFKSDFIANLWKSYGQEKLTDERISFLWSRMKNFPDDVLQQCAIDVVARNVYLPGIDRIVSSVNQTLSDYNRSRPKIKKLITSCQTCSGSGVKVVDNYAFKCWCAAGDQNYPLYPRYSGQASFGERIIFEDEQKRVTETRNTITTLNKLTRKVSHETKEDPWSNHNPSPVIERRPGASHE